MDFPRPGPFLLYQRRAGGLLMSMTFVLVVLGALILLGAISQGIETVKRDSAARSGKEQRRTCRRCGAVWYVPHAVALARVDAGEMTSARLYRASKRLSLFTTRASAAELRVQNLEDRAARVQSAASCPSCGSAAFDAEMVDKQRESPQPPGWYPDPWGNGGTRWWDGANWTYHVGGTAAPSAPQASQAGPSLEQPHGLYGHKS